MSKLLYLECNMGAAGDMLAAALYELLEDAQKQEFLHLVNEHGIPGVEVIPEVSVKCGVKGTHMSVRIHGEEEELQTCATEELLCKGHTHEADCNHEHNHELHHDHYHDHSHEHDFDHDHIHNHHADQDNHHENHDCEHDHHHHGHHHTSLAEVHKMICKCDLSEEVKENACKVYDLLAAAESHAHGVEVSEIHFHEVGMLDAVADVLNVCLLIQMLRPEKIVVSPINTGFGQVRCAHGILPVPAPATAYLLQGAPTYSGNVEGEMCTPTGAALLQFIKTEFNKQPIMTAEKTGYGMGKRDFPQANCVRSFLGYDWSSQQKEKDENLENKQLLKKASIKNVPILEADPANKIVSLSCNIDDMTGEALGFAADVLRDAGALEVFYTPIQMKKNRPGQLFTCLCRPEQADDMAKLMLKHTTSWGIRQQYFDRYVLERHTEERQTIYGTIRVRLGSGYGIEKWKPEYEDVAKAAEKYGVSIQEVMQSIS